MRVTQVLKAVDVDGDLMLERTEFLVRQTVKISV